MLGKEIKIRNIKQQREFIKTQLQFLLTHGRNDGDTQYRYLGELLPEVKKYFEKEGFDVYCLDSDFMMAATKGMPLWIFVPSRAMELTEEERKKAENVFVDFSEDERVNIDDILGGIFGDENHPKN